MLLKKYYLKNIGNSSKDHDFVEIDLEDKIIFIDTSLQDLTRYRFYQTIYPMISN